MRTVGRKGRLAAWVAAGVLAGVSMVVGPAAGDAPPAAAPAAPGAQKSEQPAAPAAPAKVLWREAPAGVERVGDETCLGCHDQFSASWQQVRHNQYVRDTARPVEQRGCEACHGPGGEHIADPELGHIINPAKLQGLAAAKPCLQCHEADLKSSHWLGSEHGQAGERCSSCHEPHHGTTAPAQLRQAKPDLCLTCHTGVKAQFKLNSHHPVLEGRVGCDDCHDPHQRPGADAKDLRKQGNDRCLKCHAEKTGPFVFEHQTSLHDGRSACLDCHNPHGSANPKLTRYFGRATCLQCHTDIVADPAHRVRPQACWSAGCHEHLHGSNLNRVFLR